MIRVVRSTNDLMTLARWGLPSADPDIAGAAQSIMSYAIHQARCEVVHIPTKLIPFLERLELARAERQSFIK